MAISKKDLHKAENRIRNTTNQLENNQKNTFIRKTITIDLSTLAKINNFRKEKSIDFSSSIRFIVNDYFSKI